MTKKQQALVEHLEDRGFDQCHASGRSGVHIGCSQCEAASICGVACHETGCPNQTRACDECGASIPKRQRLCESCCDDLFHDYEEYVGS